MRRTLLSFYLILTLGLGLHAQILMPGNDGGEKTVAISSDETFYDSGGKDKGIPKNVVSAITFTPRPGEVIEITLEELELTGGAGLYCYNGVVKLIKEEDSEGEESYTRPRNPGASMGRSLWSSRMAMVQAKAGWLRSRVPRGAKVMPSYLRGR